MNAQLVVEQVAWSPNMSEDNKEGTSPSVVKVHKCPICNKLTDSLKYRPFCSKRCADIDLGNWFTQSYVIEGKSCNIDDNIYEDEE